MTATAVRIAICFRTCYIPLRFANNINYWSSATRTTRNDFDYSVKSEHIYIQYTYYYTETKDVLENRFESADFGYWIHSIMVYYYIVIARTCIWGWLHTFVIFASTDIKWRVTYMANQKCLRDDLTPRLNACLQISMDNSQLLIWYYVYI